MDPQHQSSRGSLIHSHGIELTDQPRYLEHDAQPGLEVFEHSTLEPLNNNTPTYGPHQYPSPSYPYAHNQQALWEKAVAGGPPPPPPTSSAVSGLELLQTRPQTAYSTSNNDFSSPFDQRLLVVQPPDKKREGMICGIKKQLFWIILAISIFLLVVAVATGVGVGVGTRKGNESPLPTTTSTPTATRLFPLPVAQATTSPNGVNCPSNNLTLYTPSRTPNRKYLLLCGRDYSSNLGFGTEDLYNQRTDSMSECIEACAAQEGCVGAGWGSTEGKKTCWLKSKLGEPNWTGAWLFAVEDTEFNGTT
ncbi:hypothetical protein QBC43DRAFT_32135 [Cladorrhinum sp. PSN259]|nr:hypothetical protein QBC43DRAFT_32135 [Cladorrhinum sp. PSN259]